MIAIKCQKCQEPFEVPESLAGKQENCPKCGFPANVPTKKTAVLDKDRPRRKPALVVFAVWMLIWVGLVIFMGLGAQISDIEKQRTIASLDESQRYTSEMENESQRYTSEMGKLDTLNSAEFEKAMDRIKIGHESDQERIRIDDEREQERIRGKVSLVHHGHLILSRQLFSGYWRFYSGFLGLMITIAGNRMAPW